MAENFLPILVKQDKVYVGFTLPSASGAGGNALPVTGKNPLHLLEVAGPYLDKTPASNSSQTQCCNIVKQKAFALFNKQAQDPDSLTREETEAAALLKHLHYITERIPLSKMLLNDTGNKLLDAAKLKNGPGSQVIRPSFRISANPPRLLTSTSGFAPLRTSMQAASAGTFP